MLIKHYKILFRSLELVISFVINAVSWLQDSKNLYHKVTVHLLQKVYKIHVAYPKIRIKIL